MAAHRVAALRISIVNVTYSKHEARTKVLEALAWSFNALSTLALYQYQLLLR